MGEGGAADRDAGTRFPGAGSAARPAPASSSMTVAGPGRRGVRPGRGRHAGPGLRYVIGGCGTAWSGLCTGWSAARLLRRCKPGHPLRM